MNKAFNYLDVLLGIGVGVSFTLMFLREFGPLPDAYWILDTTIWIPTISLLIYRSYRVQAAKTKSEDLGNV